MAFLRRLACALAGHVPDPLTWLDEAPGSREAGTVRPCRRCPAYVRIRPL